MIDQPGMPHLKWLARLLIEPNPTVTGPEQIRRSRLLSSLTLPVLIATGLGLVSVLARSGSQALIIAEAAAFTVFLLAYVLSRTRHFTTAAVLTIAALFAVPAASLLTVDINSFRAVASTTMWLALPVLYSGLLLPVRATVAVAVAAIVVIVGGVYITPALMLDTSLFAGSFIVTVSTLIVVAAAIRERHEQHILAQSTELHQTNRLLAQAQQEALEANRLKSQFLAAMSHELRTPLNAILGYSQLIKEGMTGDLNALQQDNMERIFNNGQSLLALIDDILDLSKIEAGHMELIERRVALRPWAQRVERQVKGLAEGKALAFTVRVDPAMPDEIIADPDRLRQIALNLLSNAIKFTHQGDVSMQVDRIDDGCRWALTVTDTGIGIPQDALPFIFDQFRQVDASSQREYKGTGLGLAIVRQLVEMMQGTIEVTSVVNKGTIFVITLPLKTGAPQGVPHA
ncbi:MAG: sensor histidine kinase [Anaerolineae bacterium]